MNDRIELYWTPSPDLVRHCRLQKFKMAVANTVISQDNSSLHSMGTDQLLDLFVLDQEAKDKDARVTADGGKARGGEKGGGGMHSARAIIDGLEELWDESQYENEYNIETFMKSLENVKWWKIDKW